MHFNEHVNRSKYANESAVIGSLCRPQKTDNRGIRRKHADRFLFETKDEDKMFKQEIQIESFSTNIVRKQNVKVNQKLAKYECNILLKVKANATLKEETNTSIHFVNLMNCFQGCWSLS